MANERAGAPVTIYDIAAKVGVNASTVSRALNSPGRVSARTAERVKQAAAELGYRTNLMARSLQTGQTGSLGLVLSDITNPVYFDIIRGAENVAAQNGLMLVLAETQEDPDSERAILEKMQISTDGIIVGGSRLGDEELLAFAEGKPLMLLNRRVEGIDAIAPRVGPGIEQAVDLLAKHGHTSLAYVAGPRESWSNTARWEAVFEAAVAHGFTVTEVAAAEPTIEGGSDAWRRVRATGATAVLAYNDLIAMGLLEAAADAGVRVPDDLSIVGFDDIFGATLTSPKLSTVHMPHTETGMAAVTLLLDVVEPGETRQLATSYFVERQSTGPAPTR